MSGKSPAGLPPLVPPEPPWQPTEQPPRVFPARRARLIIGAVVTLAVFVGGGWWLRSEQRKLDVKQAIGGEQDQVVVQERRGLQEEHAALKRKYEAVARDRDNLLAQTQLAQEKRDEAEGVRNLLERVLKRTAEENRTFAEQRGPMAAELAELRVAREQLEQEQAQLYEELEDYRSRSRRKQLRQQLSEVRDEQKAVEKQLRRTARELNETAQREQQGLEALEGLQARLETVQQEYTNEVEENASLRREVNRLPRDVSGLAREHRRMTQELADTHFNMGIMFSKRREFRQAAKEFRKVIELKPSDPDAHYNLGIIYAEHLPNRQKAIELFRKYLTVSPKQGKRPSYATSYIATWRAWEAEERLE